MCQLNLYIVPKSVKKEYVLNVMKDCFCYQNPECVTHENLLPEIQDLNEIYVSAAMGCNCGTVQTSYQNESGEKLWVDVKRRIVEEKIEKLKKIKLLLVFYLVLLFFLLTFFFNLDAISSICACIFFL